MIRKILFLERYETFYGAGKCLVSLIEGIDKTKFQPVVIVPPGCFYKDSLTRAGVRVLEFATSVPCKPRNFLNIVRLNAVLISFVKKEGIALVHINEESCLVESLTPFFAYLRVFRVPFVFHNRGAGLVFSFFKRFIMMRGYVVCVSERIKKEFTLKRRSDLITRSSENKISIIYDGIPFTDYEGAGKNSQQVDHLKKALGINGDYVIGSVGAIDPRKRQEIFLKMAKLVSDVRKDVKFLVVGDIYEDTPHLREYREKIFSLASELGLSERVVFTGYRTDVPALLQCMDVFALTSFNEGLGDVIIEAMAAGKPVVTTADGGPAELVDDGKTGFVIQEHSEPKRYAEKVLELLGDDLLRSRMGSSAKAKAKSHYDLKVYVRQIENLYERILVK